MTRTTPSRDVAEPRTVAGRELLDALPLAEWHPINRDIVIEHILAIEAEAAALGEDRHPYHEACPKCYQRLQVARRRAEKAEARIKAILAMGETQ